MSVADGERQRVGRIFRLGKLGQAEERLNHFLHLPFAGAAAADDGEFCAERRILDHGDAFSRGCENRHALGHAQFDRALHIFQYELRFDGKRVGLMPFDEDFEAVEDDAVAFG